MDKQKKILKLAAEIALMDLDKLIEGYRRRLLILDSQIEALSKEREALAEERRKLRAERIQLHALYKINLGVLNIVNQPKETGAPKKLTHNRDRNDETV